MKQNMGTFDRIVRILAAIIIAALYLTHVITGTAATVLLVLAAILVLTSLVGFCPLYPIFGINTCGLTKKNQKSI